MNAAIIGLGRWGQNLVEAAASRPGMSLRITRGVTRTPAKAEAFAGHHRLPLSDDYAAVLADPQIGAVLLATPHSQHPDQIRAAAAAGKHIFVEKPLALTLADARQAVQSCDAARVTLATGFNRRFLPAYRALCTGFPALGTALHVDAHFSGPFGYDYSAGMWRGTASENPAGGMAAMGIHMLDAMIHLMGPVRSVAALSRRRAVTAPLDDTTTVQLDFTSGATGTLTTLMATPPHWRLHVFGAQGWGAMPDQQTLEIRPLAGDTQRTVFPATDTLADELECFADCIAGRATWPVTLTEALSGVAAMEAIARSAAESGERITVDTA